MSRVTDIHIHVQPWDKISSAVAGALREGHGERFDFLVEVMSDARLLLDYLDECGVWRAGLVSYPSPGVTGLTDKACEFALRYAETDRKRLIPFGGVDPRETADGGADVDRLVDLGTACLKIHPPHQFFPANAYTEGLGELAAIYRRASERGVPVMIHTGTSLFPGARCRYGHPMEIDDVAVDFPDLTLIMAHGGRPLWMDEAFFILRRHRNVWFDLSGIPPEKLIPWFPRIAALEDRVLWGTDWPSPGVKSPGDNLERFLALDLPNSFKEKATVTNPLILFPEER